LNNGSQYGASLIEVLVALMLIAISLLAVAPMFVSSMRQDAAGADLGLVGASTNARMELLRTMPFHALDPGGSLTANVAGYFDESNADVTVRWEIVAAGGPTGTKTIRVVGIATREVLGQAKSTEMTTIRVR
jgi:Tfp pilus assembly protein PilV